MDIRVVTERGPGPMQDFLGEPDADRLAELIVSFANAAGGTIFVGLDEAGTLYPDVAEYLEPILEQALTLCRPPFRGVDLPEWRFQDTSRGRFVTITVRPVPYQLSIKGETVYVRSGTMNVPLQAEGDSSVARRAEQPQGFEDRPLAGATLDDLDDAIVQEYQRNRIKRGPRGESLTRRELLHDAGAIDAAGQLTAAGMLLFGRHPERYFPQVGVVVVRFKGTSLRDAAVSGERYTRRVEIVGPAARVAEKAWEVLFDEIHRESFTEGLQRHEQYDYPPEAVREAVINAICHRDYAIRGQRIEVRLFDDRLEIISPGRLPGHITIDNLLDEHYSRNPRLVRGLYYWGYIEELGQGIDIMHEAMRRAHHPAPEFREGERSFAVILYNTIDEVALKYSDELNQRQLQALRYLEDHDRITNGEYSELCPDVSSETLRLDLRHMVELGLLLKVGAKRGTYYVLK